MLTTTDPHTGAITRLAHADDPHGMNWVCSATENIWFPISNSWGLGYVAIPEGIVRRWQTPTRRNGNQFVYSLGNLEMTVTRRARGGRLDEEYILRNTGKTEQPIWETRIFTPFNDNYPDAATDWVIRPTSSAASKGFGSIPPAAF